MALAAACCALPAAALLTRPDRDDAEYLELATRYVSSVGLDAPEGEAVLIAPRWLLTAAHLARAYREPKPPARLRIGQRDYEVQGVYLHPDWKPGGESDIALLLLRADVRGIDPTPVYRAGDESGKAVVIVGHGETGRLGAKPTASDRRKRASINTVDRVTARTLGVQVKSLDDASDLQGAAAGGDGGGPAYIETAEGLFVAGIGGAPLATADGIVGKAGDWETYARVSAFAPWIEATMLDVARQEAEALLGEGRR